MATAAAERVAPELSNQQLGDLIGCTHSMASRIRHGLRLPGDATMIRIAEVFGWPIEDQVRTKLKGMTSYGERFRQVEREYIRRQLKAS